MPRSWRVRFADRSGNVAVTFALLVAPMAVLAGGAIDFSVASSAKTALQDALDSAVLAGAKQFPGEDNAVTTEAAQVLDSNKSLHYEITRTFTVKDGVIHGDATIAVPTMFLGIIGMDEFPVSVSSAATKNPSQGGMELAIVVDVSGSMNSSIPALRRAVTNLLGSIYGDKAVLDDTWISIIPFSGRVNVTNYGKTWFAAGQIPSTAAFSKVDQWGITPYAATSCKITSYSSTYPRLCAARRTGDRQWDDSPPSTEPFKLFTGDAVVCPVPRAQGLVRDRATLQSITNNLCAGHGTSTQEGMAWGWRAVSPRWRGKWGDPTLPLDAADSPGKIVIIMTDGANHPSQSDDPLTTAQADAELLKTCQAMKQEGITIYAITFNMGGSISALYKKCTTKPEYEVAAESASALIAAFADIGGKIGRGDGMVRLIK